MVITVNSTVCRRNDGLLVSELGKEIVMMDVESGNYIGLNETGKAIWELVAQPIQVESLIQELLKRYSISYEECSNDTLEYLNKMNEQKILVISA